ncbi:MAG TPA: pyridoxal phosphate-dependent aminotransferase [Ktedonobacterales bacterium]|nr:pyridoxal phosphate-dependent aminotransferase [Ktedonobacterales bacterium]
MSNRAHFTRLVAGLPATVPFVAPEALERQSGRPFQLRLGANESAFGPSARAREAMRAAADQVAWYGDPESYVLREALARHHGVSMEQIVVGSGIDDLLGLIVRAFLEPGEKAVTSLGAYPTFNYHVAGYGGSLERVPYRNDRNDLQALAETAARVKARLVYLANPDNPAGTWHTADHLSAFQESLPDGCLLLLDEAYSDFAPPEAIARVEASDPRVLRLRTFSKAHGMAGARIGYAIGDAEIIKAFDKIRLHFGVNLVAQAGALAALHDTDYLREVVAEAEKGRQEYGELARSLGLPTIPSATNFVSIDVGGPERARALLTALAERDVFVRMPGTPPLNRCIRVTVGTADQRAAFATVLREVWPTVASASFAAQ